MTLSQFLALMKTRHRNGYPVGHYYGAYSKVPGAMNSMWECLSPDQRLQCHGLMFMAEHELGKSGNLHIHHGLENAITRIVLNCQSGCVI